MVSLLLLMTTDEQYMQRCLDLAGKGASQVSPNPMVGAVLVYQDRIIGEGRHEYYGGPHAEVNCIASVKEDDRQYLSQSKLYVSLEPCAHFGKTPPCASLIVRCQIPEVVIGCIDTFSEVAGKGLELLQQAGIKTTTGILQQQCRWLNRRFFTRQEMHRPYIILKWAQSEDGYMAPPRGRRVMLSNSYSQKWVHLMRGEEDAILVGYHTALLDNPRLNNRSGTGGQPIRIVVDPQLTLPPSLHLLQQGQRTMVFNRIKAANEGTLQYIITDDKLPLARQIMDGLPKINSMIIEGGAKTLQHFIDLDLWDEAVVIRTPHLLQDGLKAPGIKAAVRHKTFFLDQDTINIYHHEHTRELFGNQ